MATKKKVLVLDVQEIATTVGVKVDTSLVFSFEVSVESAGAEGHFLPTFMILISLSHQDPLSI